MHDLPEVKVFREAEAAYKEHQRIATELDLDLKIAERGGVQDQIDAAALALAEHRKNWHTLYLAHRESAVELLASIGLTPADIKYII